MFLKEEMMRHKTLWQQAAGDRDRNYAKICLKWDVILNGPGYAGAWPDCSEVLKNDGVASRKVTDLHRFSEEMEDGDTVVLRLGTTDIIGVGVIHGEYEWVDDFGDVDGWDLQHVRRVKWMWKDLKTPKSFPTYTLKQGDTTQRLDSDAVVEWIASLNLDYNAVGELTELPLAKERSISFDSVSDYLFDNGVSSASIETLSKEIDELVRIARWYQKFDNPSEFETVAYLAVPLLRALGWTPQKMAIEWNRVDIALFSQLPREDGNLSVVVEAKKKGSSCLTAVSQAQLYAKGKHKCMRLIVTDGLRYGIYLRNGSDFSLYAYFNITDLKDAYPIYECHGVKEALRAMTPEWMKET